MTNGQQALKLADELQFAIGLLVIHGIITDSERDKARVRLDRWATENGLRRRSQEAAHV